MERAMGATASRTVGFSRLLLALAVALVLGTMVAPDADAGKKGKNTIESVGKRVKTAVSVCDKDGGTATVTKKPGGTTVACEGTSTNHDWACTYHSKGNRCHATRTRLPDDVIAPPTGGLHEDPTGDGGNHAGGGAVAPRPGEADPDGGEPEQPVLR